MLRLLLVKKHLYLLLVLLLISTVNIKANKNVHPELSSSDYSEWVLSVDGIQEQTNPISKKEPGFYPNPVRDVIYLTHQENVVRVRVISLTGKTLLDIKTKEKSINLSHLSKGMYLINFDLKDGKRVARKIVKK
ncbi:T9SS type A sorting domain-containing protein [Ancylomarina sp. DW003]|nr:T9SS type A sorting domain-containing protein [Ancylomarina sp. DW003]MDE5423451.1 T9SS type A sorting domain-containing protein [Ancylomarina sp. DW003]